jgi:hypothetical protein
MKQDFRYYDHDSLKYFSVSEIININNFGKDWEWIKQEYEAKRGTGSWCADEQTQLGTIIHKFIEKGLLGLITLPSWMDWIHYGEYETVKTEVNVLHKTKFYAGTADIICKSKNDICIFDLKTVVNTDILDTKGEKFNKKINDKKNKTIIQLVAYGDAIESHNPNLNIIYRVIIYDPLNNGVVLDHIYNDSQVKAAKKKFDKYYQKCLELGLIENV